MELKFDPEADTAYLMLVSEIMSGEAVEQVIVGRPGRGDVVLDFGDDGRLLGIEVIGARELLRPDVLGTVKSPRRVDGDAQHSGNGE